MKMNKFLIAGAAIAVMSLSNAYAQEAPSNNQQEMNPTVQKTLNTVGGFFGNLVQSAKNVGGTVVDGAKTIANSEGAQNIKKGAKYVADTAVDGAKAVANSEVGQSVTDTSVKGAKYVAETATDGAKVVASTAVKGAKAVSKGYKDATKTSTEEPKVEAASVSTVEQPQSNTSLSEGVEAAKSKIGSMISFLRDKATNNTNENDNAPKMK